MDNTLAGGAVNALLDTLAAESKSYEELVALLDRERSLLVSMSPDGLLHAILEKESVLERIRSHAHERKRLLKNLAAALGVTRAEPIALSCLVGLLKEPDRTRLHQARERLVALTGRAHELNRVNDRLIHRSLAYIGQYLNLLQTLVDGFAAYRPTGVLTEHPQSGRLVALKG